MILDKQFLFIIGSPRSGTTWLQTMLSAHPAVCTTVELTLYSSYTAPWLKAWRLESANMGPDRSHQGLPFLWTEEEFHDFIREFLGRVYERVLATKPQATHVLDKHPGYSLYVRDINRLLPNARFIHIIRDGRDVAVSMMAAQQGMGFGTATVEASAATWKEKVQAARKAGRYQGRYLEISYEDLSSAGADVLKTVFDFCELTASREEVAAIVDEHQFEQMKAKRQSADKRVLKQPNFYRKGKVGSWQEELDPMQRYLFNEVAGDLLCELGYAEAGWWAESRNQMLSLRARAALASRQQTLSRVVKGTAHHLAAFLSPALTRSARAPRAKTR